MTHRRYKSLLISASYTAVSQAVALLCSLSRNKALAIWAGAAGVGAFGLLIQGTAFVSSVTGLGLSTSAIKGIAAAQASGDLAARAQLVAIVRRLAWFSGALGAALCLAFAGELSCWTFGDEGHASAYRVVAATVLLGELALANLSILRAAGRRRLLATISLMSSLVGVALVVPTLWFFGADGIVPSVLALSASATIFAWWHGRTVPGPAQPIAFRTIWRQGRAFAAMGAAFVWGGVLAAGATLAVALLLRHHGGLAVSGYFQAAMALSGVFVGFVLSAMGQDFYPKLAAVIQDRPAAVRLINRQTEIGVWLAVPGLVAMISMSEWAVALLYSPDFRPSVALLRILALGCFGRVVSWPLSYVLIAGNHPWRSALGETLFWPAYVGLSWFLLGMYGAAGPALAFAFLYFLYAVGMRCWVGALIGFRYERAALVALGQAGLFLLAASFAGPRLGLALTAASAAVSFFALRRRTAERPPAA